ncbi:Histone-lysine N-methyltransferase ASHR3 [Zea mays]|uniref:Histone-lysine N-methyltransferase ASHR3 n=1 Tax=Zea mays TaxID=4577 RepID=A0A1D6Q4P1_MAIZE|nr:Histone-lysine N-methyltransferase ASHR3 [Zea mays]
MPDLSTSYLPPFPELSLDAGALAVDHAGNAAAAASADAASAYASSSASVGSGVDDLVIPAECRWKGHVRTFDMAGAGAVTTCPAARRGGGKKLSLIPSLEPARTQASASAPTLEERVSEWAAKKAAAGVPTHHCVLPFLTGAPMAVECRLCSKIIYVGEEIKCSVKKCPQMFHLKCVAEDTSNFTVESFRCPQHEVFCRLPLPYVNEDLNIDSIIRDYAEAVYKPPPYTSIRRNVYLIKKKRTGVRVDIGCTNCRADSTCKEDCECRGLSMSCSKNCRCSDLCTNRPFRKDKKIKIVKTKRCGWGAVALEPLERGDFVIEYVGEVIDDATCEQRLWDIRRRGDKNFYMCEISKDFTIDATFKGNVSRFLNHSCEPNCKLEKWQVDGETRVGVFASRSIEVGEPLTYDYR